MSFFMHLKSNSLKLTHKNTTILHSSTIIENIYNFENKHVALEFSVTFCILSINARYEH